jgi:hypothetical protein
MVPVVRDTVRERYDAGFRPGIQAIAVTYKILTVPDSGRTGMPQRVTTSGRPQLTWDPIWVNMLESRGGARHQDSPDPQLTIIEQIFAFSDS